MPDQARLQFAGNVGFISPGIGYGWLDRRLEADLFFGWVPEAFGGDLYSLTAKLTWMPWTVRTSGWNLRPITAALQVSYAFGDEYFVLLPDRYPDGYYNFPTGTRAAFAFGIGAGRPALGLDEIGAYAELVALDLPLAFWIGNRDALGIADAFSLALGLRAAF